MQKSMHRQLRQFCFYAYIFALCLLFSNGQANKNIPAAVSQRKRQDIGGFVLISIFFIILGLLIMIVKPLSEIISKLGLNSFITGLIVAFVGFFYFMDIQ